MNHILFAKSPPGVDRAPFTAGARWHPLTFWRRLADRAVALCSAVPDDAVLDVRLFPWTGELRARWTAIRDEALGCETRVAPWTIDEWIDVDAGRTPATAAILTRVPGLASAGFSFLGAGAHLDERRGSTKALITCQLGLCVPRDGDARMRIDGRVVRWAEGETLVFDETAPHEVWNDSAHPRVVLVVRFRRPVRWLARLIVR